MIGAAALVGVSLNEQAALVWLDAAPTALLTLRQEQQEKGPQPFPCVPSSGAPQLEPLLDVLRMYAERADLCLEVVEAGDRNRLSPPRHA